MKTNTKIDQLNGFETAQANGGFPNPAPAPAAANDDAAGFHFAGACGEAEAANDNRPSPPPPAGSAIRLPSGIPLVWSASDPYVQALRAEIVQFLGAAGGLNQKRVLNAFLADCDGEGTLDSYGGRPAHKAFCKRHGLTMRIMHKAEPARALFHRFAPRFRLALTETRASSRNGYRPNVNFPSLVTDHIAIWKRDGVVLPMNRQGDLCVRGASRLLGVDYYRFKYAEEAIQLLKDAIAVGDLDLEEAFQPVMARDELLARVAELGAVLDGIDVPGGKMPESPYYRGRVDWDHLHGLTGRAEPSVRHYKPLVRRARDIADRRGMLVPGLAIHDATVAAFMDWGLEQIAADNAGKASSVAIVANHKAALNRYAKALDLGSEDEAAALFAPDSFEGNLAAALAGFGNPASAANFARMVRRWEALHAVRVGAAELPDELNAALECLLLRKGLTPTALARSIGVKPVVIQRLCAGEKGVTMADIGVIRLCEPALGQAAGVLLSKAAGVHGNLLRMAGASEAYRALEPRVRKLLPPDAALWPEQRLRAGVEQVLPLVRNGTQFAQRCSQGQLAEQRVPPFEPSPRLKAQLADYLQYKCAPIAFPLSRPVGGRWKVKTSADLRMKQIEGVIRFVAAPSGRGPASGLGVSAGYGTAAWFAHAPFGLAAMARRAKRFGGEGDPPVYTTSERETLAHLASMTNPQTGWLVQQPQLAAELRPLDVRLAPEHSDMLSMFGTRPGSLLLGPDDVAAAQRDWPAFVARNHQALLQAAAYVDDVLEVSRNPIEPIRGFVEADEPMAELMALILRAERGWASERTNPVRYKLDVRDAAMMRLAALTALRPTNLSTLLHTGDERGEIRKLDGVWTIRISYRKFKNYRSARLFGTSTARRDYELEVRDEAGMYDLLDLYFHDVLPGLRVEAGQDAAFVTRGGEPMGPKQWYDVVRKFGARHLGYNPVLGTGMPGVVGMNPYAFRHVRATDILKNGVSYNRLEEAAFALQTSEAMVRRHYGFLLPKDAILKANATFDRALRLAAKRNL